jgi:hypothetical protein
MSLGERARKAYEEEQRRQAAEREARQSEQEEKLKQLRDAMAEKASAYVRRVLDEETSPGDWVAQRRGHGQARTIDHVETNLDGVTVEWADGKLRPAEFPSSPLPTSARRFAYRNKSTSRNVPGGLRKLGPTCGKPSAKRPARATGNSAGFLYIARMVRSAKSITWKPTSTECPSSGQTANLRPAEFPSRTVSTSARRLVDQKQSIELTKKSPRSARARRLGVRWA